MSLVAKTTSNRDASSDGSTADRILATALRLFNEHGVDRVAIYKVAADLNISPGNLTYHFAKKYDLVVALVERFEQEASLVLKTPRNAGAPELARYIISIFRLMWRYHFLFQSPHVAASNDRIANCYDRIRVSAQTWSMQRIEDAVACGDIPPVKSPNSSKILAENMWAVWVNRLSLKRGQSEGADSGQLAVYDCCIHHISLIQPYASNRYINNLHELVKDLLDISLSDEPAPLELPLQQPTA